MDVNAQELLRQSDMMFSKKEELDDLHQRVAEEICPDRATFTTDRVVGEEFTDHLYTSLPAQNHRDLSYAMGSLTRPKNQVWFHPKARDDERNTDNAKAWFQRARDKQRTLLYSHRANWQVAMEISDRDVVAFGNAVISHSENPMRDGTLVYQTHHLKDTAWAENKFRIVDRLDRKFRLCLRNWNILFPGVPMPKDYLSMMDRDPYHEVDLMHIVLPADRYDAYNKRRRPNRMPYASIYLDPRHKLILREKAYWEFPYTVRRWQLQDGTPYARSPAADLGLVEARLLQNQERVINEAGELSVDPPWVATYGAVLGDIHNYPGGTTWIDADYDERSGIAARAVEHKGNIPIGLEMKVDTRQILAAAMFINKLTLPTGNKDMTVPEINERIAEYIRSIGPAVEPFETHNALLLDNSFNFNLRIGQFGPIEQVPPELRGADVVYEFDGPIQIAYKRQKLNKIRELYDTVAPIAKMQVEAGGSPDVLDNFDIDDSARKAAEHIGVEPEIILPFDRVEEKRAERAKMIAAKEQQAQAAEMARLGIDAGKALPQMMQGDAGLQASLGQLGQEVPQLGGGGPTDLLPLPGYEDGGAGMGAMGGDGAQSLGALASMWGGGGQDPLDAEYEEVAPGAGQGSAAMSARPPMPPLGAMPGGPAFAASNMGGGGGFESDDLDAADAEQMEPPPQRAGTRGRSVSTSVARSGQPARRAAPAASNSGASATDQAIAALVRALTAPIEISKSGDGKLIAKRRV